MTRFTFGILAGLIFAVLDVLIMLPMEFEDKRSALLGAFVNRFSIGFVIGATNLGVAPWIIGLLFGFLLSLPDAIITKAWAPILGIGLLGGGVIGWTMSLWAI